VNVLTRGMRNAFRNGIRTFSIIIILSLSIALALAMVLARGAVQTKIDSVKGSIGNTVTIAPAGVKGFEGGGEPLQSSAIDSLKDIAHVAAVTKNVQDRLDSDSTNLQSAIDAGTLGKRFRSNSAEASGPVMVIDGESGAAKAFSPPLRVSASTDLTASEAATNGTVNLTSGALFATDSTENVAIVGKSLAEKNNLSVGATFTAYATTIKVVGIYDTGNTFTNGGLLMPLASLQKLSGQEGELSDATVKVDSITNVSSTVAAIKNKLGTAADVTDQQSEAESALAPLENIKTISLFSLIGAVIAGAVIILLTMIMIVRERRREIGVLKAIGASNLKVMFQFMSEAVTFTVIAAAIGILLGVAAGNPITSVLVNNSSSSSNASGGGKLGGGPMLTQSGPGEKPAITQGPRGVAKNLGFGTDNLKNVKAVVGWDILLYGLGVALLIALAGSATAALLIAKIRPAEVMRVE
jgi:putative ABC transport system permease protein